MVTVKSKDCTVPNYLYSSDQRIQTSKMVGIVCFMNNWDATFLQIWLILSALSFVSLLSISAVAFYFLYGKPTYETWIYKINPQYPTPQKVREEITVMLQGLIFSTICPALSVFFSQRGMGWGYCGNSYGTT